MTPERSRDPRQERRDRRSDPTAWSAHGARAVVATAHYRATDAAEEVLAGGGNAIDAAVAGAFALGVCEPAGSGLGGMATAVVRDGRTGEVSVWEGACPAPQSATPERVASGLRYHGHGAVAVPTAPAVLAGLAQQHGRLPLAELVRPAVELARSGVLMTRLRAELTERYVRALQRHGAGRLFLDSRGRTPAPGTLLQNPALADTLERLGRHGVDDFYRGEIAHAIAADMAAHEGYLTLEDLAAVDAPRRQAPLSTPLLGRSLVTAGPPAGGLALAQLCTLLEASRPTPQLDTPEGLCLFAALVQRARQDRKRLRLEVGARDVAGAAVLLDPEHARAVADAAAARMATGSGETSHISAIDAEGHAIALTVSIERSFGAGCLAGELGFPYNGYLRAFKVENEAHPHYLRPGAVARSNASPTLVLEDGRPWAAVGATGSERMTSTIAQILLRLDGSTPFDALWAPRLHCTPEGRVILEANRFTGAQRSALARHFTLEPLEAYAFQMGGAQLAVQEGDRLTAVADPRRDGAAAAT